jgi:hypothetical protein
MIRTPYSFVASLLVFFSATLAAQTHTSSARLEWKSPRQVRISRYDSRSMPYFEGAIYKETTGVLPWFSASEPLKSGAKVQSAQFGRTAYIPVTSEEAALIPASLISAEPQMEVHIVFERKKPQLEIQILPFRSRGGQIEKLVSWELSVNVTGASSPKSAQATTTESVLASGTFYKFGVTASGVYRIPKSLMSSAGINVSVNPQHIRIYGNGGGMVPERNDAYYPDDLIENAIYVSGESDGSFDDGDYVLFYALGPVTWSYDEAKQMFRHTKNLYADTAWYYVTLDKGPGKRIENLAQADVPATSTATVFDDYAFIENDEENFINSGRRWFGNRMEVVNSHAFTMGFNNLLSGPHKLASRIANRGNATTYSVSVAGNAFSQAVSASQLDYLAPYATENESVFSFNATASSFNVSVAKPSSSSIGWLDYFVVNVRRNLIMDGSWMDFRLREPVASGAVVEYQLGNTNSSVVVWDVTNPFTIRRQLADQNGSTLIFKANADTLREYVAVNLGGSFPLPHPGAFVPNQNLHGLAQAEYIIVAPSALMSVAENLANIHREADNLSVVVVDAAKIYNEFSSGKTDIGAIRNFTRMFYERAGTDPNKMPKYLLLMGDGTFRPKKMGENGWTQLPTYESVESVNPIGSFGSDDFFGLLDPTEGANIHTSGAGALDISVGRFPCSNVDEATSMVNKVRGYRTDQGQMNDWRNRICFIADDEDSNAHFNQQELVSSTILAQHPVYNVDKVYLDAYPQETGSGGQRYPAVNQEILNEMNRGVLMMNYAGHGGEEGLSQERVITIPDIEAYENVDNLPLFLTATCEFSRFDNPDFTSAGEYLVLNPAGGAISAFTTTRLTFSTSNQALNKNVMDTLFSKVDGQYQTMGDILRRGKNKTGSSFNSRSFALLGDPALKLAYPRYSVVTTSINGKDPAQFPDTLSALEYITVTGYVSYDGVNVASDFNGVVTPTVFDKPTTLQTLGNDGTSLVVPFNVMQSVIFRGPASVTNGQFTFSFVVPQDIQLPYGFGKISYYAKRYNSLDDAHGALTNLIVGGFSANPVTDNEGPAIQLYMNNTRFVSGGITDENPSLLAFVEDDLGINTVGTGIGHDITAVLDGNTSNPYILNDFYESELDNFRKGKVEFPFKDLAEGPHSLTFKVWDVANNSASASIDFVVVKNEEMALEHVLNYPNPFSTQTQFFFETNQPGVPLHVEIQVFTVSGKMVKQMESVITTSGYRSEPITWNGRDDFGDKIGRGVYVYRVRVVNPEGKAAEKFEKLVILN